MNKTLYISDLDGTLLNRDAELSEYTTDVLNRLIDSGLCFSIATARTAATCNRILKELKLNLPVILMNGVLIYDFGRKQYIKKEPLANEKVAQIICAMRKSGQTGLMYGLYGEGLVTYYEYIPNDAIRNFIDERISKYGKKFTRLDSFSDARADIIYFCYMDTQQNIQCLYEEIKLISGLRIEKYRDIYSDGDLWYMEVFADTASKCNAVRFLRCKYGFDRVVAFGDNLNDLSMFEASDECYAVANAKDEVKEKATAVIGANAADGVAKWINGLMD